MKKVIAISISVVALCAAIFAAEIKLSWTYNGTTNDTAGFAIYYGPSSRNYTNVQRTGFVTNTVISGLSPDTTYFLSGVGVTPGNLESDWGNELQVRTAPSIPPSNSLPTVVKDFRLR